jgi:hypothetical protein
VADPATTAWIFYSLGLASQTSPANFHAISQVADGLNHAVPTHKEMQTSLRWLINAGLVAKVVQGYSLSPAGAEFLFAIEADTASEVLHRLTARIGDLLEPRPDSSMESTRES